MPTTTTAAATAAAAIFRSSVFVYVSVSVLAATSVLVAVEAFQPTHGTGFGIGTGTGFGTEAVGGALSSEVVRPASPLFTTTTATATSTSSSSGRSPTTTGSSTALNMFTGIIEEMGEVISLEERTDMELWDGTKGSGTELTVKGDVVMDGAYLGCSIAVNGVCLTATTLSPDTSTFTVGLAPETLRKTYFSTLTPGTPLNLERASEIGGRNSGHFVQGHIDGTATIIDKWEDEDSLFFKVQMDDADLMRYIVPKGFVAIDGTSLTVCETNAKDGWFTFMLVEYTQKKIVIPGKDVGEKLNIEVDVLAKYSEASMAAIVPRVEELEGIVEKLVREMAELKGVKEDLGRVEAAQGKVEAEQNEIKSAVNGIAKSLNTGTVTAAWAVSEKQRGSTRTLPGPISGGTIENWKLLPNNSITGSALDNPTPEIRDGSDITTAAIVEASKAVEGGKVQTKNGVLYTLGKPRAVSNGVAEDETAPVAMKSTDAKAVSDWGKAQGSPAKPDEMESPKVAKSKFRVVGTSW